jgi:Tetratricopeptide repeat
MHVVETPTNIIYRTPESGNPETPRQGFVPELEQPNLSTRTGGNPDIAALETTKQVAKGKHPSTLTNMANLASTYWSQGRWIEAEELEVQVMEKSLRVLGQEHPDTLTSMAHLASTYWSQRRWIKAEELGVQVMETRIRVLGQEHPSTLKSMAHLALDENKGARPGTSVHAEEHGPPSINVLESRTVDKGRRTRSASDGDENKGARPGTSVHAEEHGLPSINVLESRTVDKGRRTKSASDGDENKGARPGAS